MNLEDAIFNRTRLLTGDDGFRRISEVKVIIFGVGGVGSWCAEALVRSGVRYLTIVDSDCVSVSNINRQLMATTETIGQVKVEALKRHLLTINPAAVIDAREEVFSEETAANFHLDDYDYIVDCIDSLKNKALLIERATRTKARFYASMGAALKMDPTRIRVAEFMSVKGCPLARALRNRFKRAGRYPSRKFMCVYSDEVLKNQDTADVKAEAVGVEAVKDTWAEQKAQINGSLMHITSIFGITIGGLIIKDITSRL